MRTAGAGLKLSREHSSADRAKFGVEWPKSGQSCQPSSAFQDINFLVLIVQHSKKEVGQTSINNLLGKQHAHYSQHRRRTPLLLWSNGALQHTYTYTKMIFDRKVLLAVTCSAGVFFRAAAATATEGKSTKGTKSQSNLVYFLNPSSCPQDCVQCAVTTTLAAGTPQDEGHGTGESVQACDAENKHQMWRFHQKDGLTTIESYFNPGDCLAVVPPQEAGDGDGLGFWAAADSDSSPGHGGAEEMCHHNSLGLMSCNDPAAQWLFNGGNLISALCWKNGISSFMAVNEECSELSVLAADGGNDALMRSQTFILTEQDFIETIVPASIDEADSTGSDSNSGDGGKPSVRETKVAIENVVSQTDIGKL